MYRTAIQEAMILLITLTWSVISCGGDGGRGISGTDIDTSLDAGTPGDPSTRDPSLADCPETHGPTSIVNTLERGDRALAFDLDGDGLPDNRFADTRDDLDQVFESSLQSGDLRLALELRELDDATLRDDPALVVGAYEAIDLDDPENPDDDFSGAEPFVFATDDVHPEGCEPISRLTASLSGGELTGTADFLPLPFGELGALPLRRARVRAQITPIGEGFRITEAHLGGIVTACSFHEMAPLGDSNLLWFIAFSLRLQPDMDLDGDGLETIQTDRRDIVDCTDPRSPGDRDPIIITGEDCACAEGMADGYSIFLIMTGVGAALLGPV